MLLRVCCRFSSKLFTPNKNAVSLTNFKLLRCSSTATTSVSHQLVPLSSIPPDDLGVSILHLKENGSGSTPTDSVKRILVVAKVCSLGSTALGVIMIPALTSYLWEAATERPSMMAFTVIANAFLGLLTFTPLLLHFLAKRYVVNLYYNADSKIFTTVHYNFFLQKRALRFCAEDVVDAAIAPETKKLWLPLATCFVGGKPLLISLDRHQYRHESAFDLLTKNITIPKGHD
uniref:Transmembrane protein 70 n=1 Tax=Panagrolaimus sp. PS1159 TaxID=55785 RepID=A0AC35GJ00_9BILA